jgi:hypothetical protein
VSTPAPGGVALIAPSGQARLGSVNVQV